MLAKRIIPCLDVTGGRDLILSIIEAVASQVFIPLTAAVVCVPWKTCAVY